MKATSKGCGSCGDGVIGCAHRNKGYRQRVWFLWGWGKRVWHVTLHYMYIRGVAVGDGVTGQMSMSFQGQIPQMVHNNSFCNDTML